MNITPGPKKFVLTVLYGLVDLKKIELTGIGSVKKKDMVVNAGENKIIKIK